MKTLTRGSFETLDASSAEAIEIARAIPARVTVCFIWVGVDLIAVGSIEEGYKGIEHAREQMIVSGNVVGKSYLQLRRERAAQLRAASQAEIEVAPLAELLELIEIARAELQSDR